MIYFSQEMRRVLFSSLLQSVNYTTNHSTSLILSFVTFSAFYALEGDLDLQTVSCYHSLLNIVVKSSVTSEVWLTILLEWV